MSLRPIVSQTQPTSFLNQTIPEKQEKVFASEPKFFLQDAIEKQKLNSPQHTGKTEITRKFYSVLAGHPTEDSQYHLLPLNFYKLSQNHYFRKDYLQYCLFGFIRDEAGNNVTNLFFDKFDENFCSILKLIPARKNEQFDASRLFFGFNKSLFTNRTKEFLNVVYGGNNSLFTEELEELLNFEVRGTKLKENSYLSNLVENFTPFQFGSISLHRSWFERESDPHYKNSLNYYKKAILNSHKCFFPKKFQVAQAEQIDKFSAEVEAQCEKFEKKFMPKYVKNMKENFLKNMAEYVNSNFFDFLKTKEDEIRLLKNNINFFNKYFNLISYIKENNIDIDQLKDESFISNPRLKSEENSKQDWARPEFSESGNNPGRKDQDLSHLLNIPNSILPLTSLKNKKEFIKTFLLLKTDFIETYEKVDLYFKEKLDVLKIIKAQLELNKDNKINEIEIQLVNININFLENALNDKSQYFDHFHSV